MQNIDWSKLKVSYGDSTILPLALEKLISHDENDRKWAASHLDNMAVLQGDLYEAAYYVIEPIIEILENKNCSDFYTPLLILSEVALGTALESDIITVDENNVVESLPLRTACRMKLSRYKERLQKLDFTNATQKEKGELNFLLEEIESFSDEKKNNISLCNNLTTSFSLPMNADSFEDNMSCLYERFPQSDTEFTLIPVSFILPIPDNPILELYHKYRIVKFEVAQFSLNTQLREMQDLNPDDNITFNKTYYLLGKFRAHWLAMNKVSSEVLILLNDAPLLKFTNHCWYVTKDARAFLETLYYLEKNRAENQNSSFWTQESYNSFVSILVEKAGGDKYRYLWTKLSVSIAKDYGFTIPEH